MTGFTQILLAQGEVEVPPPPVTFGVTGRAATPATFTSNLVVNLPPANAGDLILVAAWTGSTAGGPGNASGYQRIGYVNPGGGNAGLAVYARDATGTGADACTVAGPQTAWASAMSWVIEKSSANAVGVVANYAPRGGVNVPFPAVTFQPVVPETPDFLTIVAAQLTSAVGSVTSYPAGYTQGRANFNVNGGCMAVAEKDCTALPPSYGEAPGNMVVNTGGAFTTMTITITNNDPAPARGYVSTLPDVYLEDDVLSPNNPSASIAFNNDGTIAVTGNGSTINSPGRWYNPATSDLYNKWFRMTLVSGIAPTSGAVGTWVQLNLNSYYGWPSSVAWSWSRSALGVTNATWKIEIATDPQGFNIVAISPNYTTLLAKEV